MTRKKRFPIKPWNGATPQVLLFGMETGNLIRLPDRLPMLYHLSEDIAEQHDLSLLYPEKTKSMLKKLGTWEMRLPHPVFHEPVEWRVRHLGFYDAGYQLVQPQD